MNQEYKIITDATNTQFNARVTKAIASGWKLQGGVAVAVSPAGITTYAQAMTRNVTKGAKRV